MSPSKKIIHGSIFYLTKKLKQNLIMVIGIIKSSAFNDFNMVITSKKGGKRNLSNLNILFMND